MIKLISEVLREYLREQHVLDVDDKSLINVVQWFHTNPENFFLNRIRGLSLMDRKVICTITIWILFLAT